MTNIPGAMVELQTLHWHAEYGKPLTSTGIGRSHTL